ncbi:MAG: DUF3782 domain-containing protein [Candidatus Helarchaeota archaeon]
MTNPISEDEIKKFIEKEIDKRILERERDQLLTRAEFLKAIDAFNKRFEELTDSMNKRFEAMDKRFEELIDSMNKRFEAVDRRFEELIDSMNRRFEAVDKRFEAMDKRFEELIDSMNRRFEAVDKRFEAMDKRFDDMNKRFDESINILHEMIAEIRRGHDTLKVAIGSLGQRSGINLEKTILKLLKKALEKRNIDINKIEWIELHDEKGEVFSKNYRTDIDILIKNGFHFLMEVKYHPDNRDVFHFLKVAELYTKKYQAPNKLILVCLDIDLRTKEFAEREHIEVITSDIE